LAASAGALGLAGFGVDHNRTLDEVAGVSTECKDIRGTKVRVVSISDLGDVGRAGVINRVPVIAIDPALLATLPPKLQIFFYVHECAHHVLGHPYTYNLNRESEADCWAIKHGRDNGHFARADVEAFAPYLRGSGGSAWGHLPGPERARHMLQCFDEK
jgi:hypothetical protein